VEDKRVNDDTGGPRRSIPTWPMSSVNGMTSCGCAVVC
jgi:hypothetical protein